MKEDKILLSHGSGGRLMHELINDLILKNLSNPFLSELKDSAILEINGRKIAFTTDSYVVNPVFFGGGDIGKLAICGTINDLSAVGARPLFISLSLIIEEGFEVKNLERIIESIRNVAENENVIVVTGDTKVVERGKGDKIFINTSGIGIVEHEYEFSYSRIKPGDKIIINGGIAEHGIAILNERLNLKISNPPSSDCKPLWRIVEEVLKTSEEVKFMRDPTRGGLASALNEIASRAGVGIELNESKIPVKENVLGICELLGLDPLYIANEGKMIFIVSEKSSERVVRKLKEIGENEAEIVGEVIADPKRVLLRTLTGGRRIVELLSGEPLPRIC
ncbi:MAG: hydrogenase expression/formation protein HypE [Candidatus Aminicenantia bacterium]